jgi:hypothetical protein
MGTVIVTSHDRDASTLLDGKSEIIDVNIMTQDESRMLLCRAADYNSRDGLMSNDLFALLNETVRELDHLPLAIDLAGRRIARAQQEFGSFDTESSLKNAVRNFTNDFRLHRRELLGAAGLSRTISYQKTVWTVWETSLASLQKFERYHPLQLLSLMARLDEIGIPTALFRHASSGVRAVCAQPGIEFPSWLGELLKLRDNGDWDDFAYRETVDILQRFGLVRPVVVHGSPGVTMYKLVRWRVAEEATTPEDWTSFLLFVVAVCRHYVWDSSPGFATMPLDRYMLRHVPTTTDLITKKTCFSDDGLTWAWMSISSFLAEDRKWEDCEKLHEAALSLNRGSLGDLHTTTTSIKARLDDFRVLRERSERAQKRQFSRRIPS